MDLFTDTLAAHRVWFRDCALHAAFELGLVQALVARPRAVAALADVLGLPSDRRLARLIDVLVAEGMVLRAADGLLRARSGLVRPDVPAVASGWGALAEVLRTDRPLTTTDTEAAAWQDHMRQVALRVGDALFDAIGPTGPALLDLGSGTGALAEVFLRRAPHHRATLVDTPEVLAGVDLPRTTCHAGDALTVELADARFDVVLLSHLLHLHDTDTARHICQRAARHLADDGRVVVRDFDLATDRRGPLTGLYFALNMALYTDAGDVHSPDHIADWLREAGLTEVTIQRGPLGPDVVVIVAQALPPGGAGRAVGDLVGVVQTAIAETGRRVRDGLGRRGLLHPAAPDLELELPPMLSQMLAAALEAADDDTAAMLRMHYTELMPRLLVEQLCSTNPASARLFHAPLDIWQTHELRRALVRLTALAERAGVPATTALPPAMGEVLGSADATLAVLYPHTHFGRCMPLLSTYPHDLATYGAELDAGRDVQEVIDDWLAAPLVHELAHGPRHRDALWPPYLDECLAGEIGERVLPGLGWPRVGQPHAIFGTPWFAQVGLALVRAAGSIDAVVAAHLGVRPWPEVLPDGLPEVLERVGWQAHLDTPRSHLMGDILRPTAWVKLILIGAAGRLERDRPPEGWTLDAADAVAMASLADDLPVDEALDRLEVRRAVHTMMLHPVRLDTGTVRVRCEAPDTPVRLDWVTGVARGTARGAALADPVHVLPAAVCRRWLDGGVEHTTLRIEQVDRLEAITERLLQGP